MQSDTKQMCPFVSFFACVPEGMRFFAVKKEVVPMEPKQNSFLETEETRQSSMRKYSIPCVISFVVGALYNIVDQIFIANAAYLGSYGNAANTVVFSAYGSGAGCCRNDRRRLLCLCQHCSGRQQAGGRSPQCR